MIPRQIYCKNIFSHNFYQIDAVNVDTVTQVRRIICKNILSASAFLSL